MMNMMTARSTAVIVILDIPDILDDMLHCRDAHEAASYRAASRRVGVADIQGLILSRSIHDAEIDAVTDRKDQEAEDQDITEQANCVLDFQRELVDQHIHTHVLILAHGKICTDKADPCKNKLRKVCRN